jgi:hypothetical protein
MQRSPRWQRPRRYSSCALNACPPWDNATRECLGCDTSESGYLTFLLEVRRLLRAVADEARVPVAQLPALVGWPGSSPAKLVDEYLWVRYARGCTPPPPERLAQWAGWARGAPDGE